MSENSLDLVLQKPIKQIFNRHGKSTNKIRKIHIFWRNFSFMEKSDETIESTSKCKIKNIL